MARIEGVPKSKAGPVVRLAYRFGPRMMRNLAGREPQNGSGLEPMEIWAHNPKMMMGMGKFNQAVRKGKTVEAVTNLPRYQGPGMVSGNSSRAPPGACCQRAGWREEGVAQGAGRK